ncbi:LON peptidase substrate-binding domain-containing protein [Desertimonas flava]|jgi:Lon protease-like protein|uniref:LON peptidase substrate-binding domain-containing protein n=1 Tax=Desertimonas flava TaxID=2064846 RepID=UPI000E344868|nr:LON peptidase substrate-binding domain-containing protein [Desertimonas flava]
MKMAMFPLGNVVLPGEMMPLRVFEPRYRRLVLDCLAGDGAPEFAIVLIERGSEVGGGDERTSIGTVVSLRNVAPLGAGRFNIVAAAVRRVSVLEWLPDDPYPIADVEDWPDKGPGDDDLGQIAAQLATLAERVPVIRGLAAQVNPRAGLKVAPRLQLSTDVVAAGYQLATAVPLGAADRFQVLQAPTVASRVATLAGVFDDLEAALRFRLGGPPTAE